MSVFSSGSKWKKRAQAALKKAQTIEDYQRDVEFQRSLLSNIRQQRLAQAQLSLMNYSESFTSSSAAGASANVDSALASEMDYGYGTSQRMEKIQDYQQAAQQYMKKYAKQLKKKAAGFAVVGAVAGAVTGGLGFGLMGAVAGASIGQGVGQMASNTGQFETGLNNVISGASQAYQAHEYRNEYERLLDRLTPKTFELTSIDPKTGKPIQGSTVTTTYTPGSLSYLNQNIFN